MTTSAEDEASPLGALRVGLDTRPGIIRQRSWRQRLRLPLMLLGPIVVLLAGAYWFLTTGRYISTDDAYVDAARVSISNEVSGRVAEIDVHDNEQVTAGQVLFTLDQRPFRIAVEEAKAQLAAVRLQIEAMKATYQQKKADAAATEATLVYQQRELERQQRLLAGGGVLADEERGGLHAVEQFLPPPGRRLVQGPCHPFEVGVVLSLPERRDI